MSELSKSLDIVVPCYNPGSDWEKELVDLFTLIDNSLPKTHVSLILVIDGPSTGVGLAQLNHVMNCIPSSQIIEHPTNKGKGYALRQGVSAASSEFIIFTDVDFPYEIDSLVKVYRQLCDGTDVVLGYREQDYYAKVPLFRKMLSKTLRWVLRSLLRLSITDTQCGLKGFNESGKKLFLATTIDRFLFDLEFVMLSSKDTTISTAPVLVKLREGVIFSKVNMKVLLVELANLFVLTFYKRKPSPHA